MVITGVGDRISERIRALVYLDAFLPQDGQSLFDINVPANTQMFIDNAGKIGGLGVPPPPAAFFNVNPDDAQRVDELATPFPIGCFTEKIKLSGKHNGIKKHVYVHSTVLPRESPFKPFYERVKNDPAWSAHTLACGHDAMLDLPDDPVEVRTNGAAPAPGKERGERAQGHQRGQGVAERERPRPPGQQQRRGDDRQPGPDDGERPPELEAPVVHRDGFQFPDERQSDHALSGKHGIAAKVPFFLVRTAPLLAQGQPPCNGGNGKSPSMGGRAGWFRLEEAPQLSQPPGGLRSGCAGPDFQARLASACSFSKMATVVRNTVSGISEMLSMPCSTRNCAKSG